MEELLRMGSWDFVINLSGSDLPLRSVDDLAYMLAPYRGYNLIRFNGPPLSYGIDEAMKAVWYACGGHLYNVTSRGDRGQLTQSASMWAVISREMAEFAVAPIGYEGLTLGQFHYLSSGMIPDEVYFGSLTHLTSFKEKHILKGLHFTKMFHGDDSKNLCRHRDETDTCGQGPGFFSVDDMPMIAQQTHTFFFGRKFKMEVNDWLRQMMMQMVAAGSYSSEQKRVIPASFIRSMADLVIPSLKKQYRLGSDFEILNITDFAITPRLRNEHPCCETVALNGYPITQEYMYWIELLVQDNDSIRKVRAGLEYQKAPNFKCYNEGPIRSIRLTTKTEGSSGPGMLLNLPLPFEPVEQEAIWVALAMDSNLPSDKCKDQPKASDLKGGIYPEFPPVDPEKYPPAGFGGPPPSPEQYKDLPMLPFKIRLRNPSGSFVCEEEVEIQAPLPNQPQGNVSLFTHAMRCGPFTPGWWKVEVYQKTSWMSDPIVYSQEILLLPMPMSEPGQPPLSVNQAEMYKHFIGDAFVEKYMKVHATGFLEDLDPSKFYDGFDFDLDSELKETDSIFEAEVFNPEKYPNLPQRSFERPAMMMQPEMMGPQDPRAGMHQDPRGMHHDPRGMPQDPRGGMHQDPRGGMQAPLHMMGGRDPREQMPNWTPNQKHKEL